MTAIAWRGGWCILRSEIRIRAKGVVGIRVDVGLLIIDDG